MNKWLKIYAGIVVVSCYFNTLITFTIAYFNDMRTLVTINDYVEANLEFFMLETSLLIVLKWTVNLFNRKAEK